MTGLAPTLAVCLLLLAGGAAAAEEAADGDTPPEAAEGEDLDSFLDGFIDDEDGYFDLSEWLAQPAGFMPIAIPITEPAIGAGLMGGLVFFHPNEPTEDGEKVPPSVSAAFGGGTTNGTWVAGAGHMGIWDDDNIRYTGGVAAFSVNLEYYGLGDDAISGDRSVDYTLSGWAILQDIRFRIPGTDLFLGGAYTYVRFDSEFDFDLENIETDTFESTDNLARLNAVAQVDTRDNIFTPTCGILASAKYFYQGEAIGSDFTFNTFRLDAQGFLPVTERLVLGGRLQYGWGSDGSPFFMLPSLWMRGLPAMRYFGQYMTQIEVEPRFELSDRWAVVAFGGVGRVGLSPEGFRDNPNIYAGGGGFRYLIARKLGIWAGCDVAWSEDTTAFYITFGTAWVSL